MGDPNISWAFPFSEECYSAQFFSASDTALCSLTNRLDKNSRSRLPMACRWERCYLADRPMISAF